MRTLGIDFGTKRVGLALSDEGGRFATPFEVMQVASPEQAIDRIVRLIEKEGIERLVVGVPVNMDESFGPAARATCGWARTLRSRTKGALLVFVDERLSSFAAEQDLIQRKRGGEKLTRKRKKEQLDALAAAGFLQAFLDGKLPALKMG